VHVLGLSLGTDPAAALVRDGELVAVLQEERLDRTGRRAGVIPMRAVTAVLEAAGIGIDEADVVVGTRPSDDGSVGRLLTVLPMKDKARLYALPMPSYHLAHAYAGFLASPFGSAAVLVADGAGSLVPGTDSIEKHTVFVGEDTALRRVYGTTAPADGSAAGIGRFLDFFTAELGRADDAATAALAPYGVPRPDWEPLLALDEGDAGVATADLGRTVAGWRTAAGHADVARKAQDEAAAAMLHLARHAYELTGQSRLCLAGSVARNHAVNQRIVEQGPFAPAPGDAATAIGAAYFGTYAIGGVTARRPVAGPPPGRAYSRRSAVRALESTGEAVYWREADVPEIAGLIAAGHVVGWVQGGSEPGGRGLGRRSILATPADPRLPEYLNRKVTHREEPHPYGASVLAERAGDWFESTVDSPFMLLAPRVRTRRRASIPAVTQIDGTALVQTVRAGPDPRFHRLLAELDRVTGVPIVLNAPLHGLGEPIVESPADAVRAFLGTGLDYLYLDDLLIGKQQRDGRPTGNGATP
jgi:carbamoyltransferase